jgi:hypothetical protein
MLTQATAHMMHIFTTHGFGKAAWNCSPIQLWSGNNLGCCEQQQSSLPPLLQLQTAHAAEEAAALDRGRSHEAALAARVAADRECDARQHAELHARGMQQVRLATDV